MCADEKFLFPLLVHSNSTTMCCWCWWTPFGSISSCSHSVTPTVLWQCSVFLGARVLKRDVNDNLQSLQFPGKWQGTLSAVGILVLSSCPYRSTGQQALLLYQKIHTYSLIHILWNTSTNLFPSLASHSSVKCSFIFNSCWIIFSSPATLRKFSTASYCCCCCCRSSGV